MGGAVFSGTDAAGRPTLVSRTVRGTKKDARRVAAELTLKPSNAAGRTVGDLLAAWQEVNADTWALSGIEHSWRLHDLRHWSATQAIGHGHDVRTVAGRLGHANAAMTLRIYAHVLEEADQAVVATLAGALDVKRGGSERGG